MPHLNVRRERARVGKPAIVPQDQNATRQRRTFPTFCAPRRIYDPLGEWEAGVLCPEYALNQKPYATESPKLPALGEPRSIESPDGRLREGFAPPEAHVPAPSMPAATTNSPFAIPSNFCSPQPIPRRSRRAKRRF